MRKSPLVALFSAALMSSCSSVLVEDSPSFLDDANFLSEHADGQLVISGTGGYVFTPSLQGRVMISAVDLSEPSQGFLNYDVVKSPPEETPFTNYGGEDRFWIGPEGSANSFYFDPGDEMDLDHWRLPAELDSGAFHATTSASRMERRMTLSNRNGQTFHLRIERSIETPTQAEVEELVGALPKNAKWTAFRSVNTVYNDGNEAWTQETGLPCIWTLGMFKPAPNSLAVLPFRTDSTDPDQGPPVRTEYFGELDDDRFRIENGFALFRIDAKYKSKVGIYRNRAKNVMAAFNPDTRVLTVVQFSAVVPKAPYVNERWVTDVDPYYGDVINSYNHDGPEQFFELESSSPGLELEPGKKHTHVSTTCHFRFETDAQLADAVWQALGLDWAKVEAAWF